MVDCWAFSWSSFQKGHALILVYFQLCRHHDWKSHPTGTERDKVLVLKYDKNYNKFKYKKLLYQYILGITYVLDKFHRQFFSVFKELYTSHFKNISTVTQFRARKKKIEFQLALRTSSPQILLALGKH